MALFRTLVFLLFTTATACLGQVASAAGCLQYGPRVVRITGTLIRRTFPGPPGYESIREGDKPETYWLLDLSSPVCVDEDKVYPEFEPAHKQVRRIQLVLDPKAYKENKGLVGKRVAVTGTLFSEQTGHHHTPVLLVVTTLGNAE
jgi:hypothetical protein